MAAKIACDRCGRTRATWRLREVSRWGYLCNRCTARIGLRRARRAVRRALRP